MGGGAALRYSAAGGALKSRSSAGGTSGRRALGAVLLAAAALALYANALGNPFISDDERVIATNPTIVRPSAAGLRKLWTTDYWEGIDPDGRVTRLTVDRNLYRPVTILSFWLNARIAGVRPWSFRVVNVLLHAASAWLVALLGARWFGRRAAVVAALAVLLHPVATDVVNRIVGRADILVLLGIAGVLAIQSIAAERGWTWALTGAAAAFTAVAIGAKESGLVVVPLAFVSAWLAPAGRRPLRFHARPVLAIAVPLVAYTIGRSLTVDWPRYDVDRIWDLLGNPLWSTGIAARLPAVGALAWTYVRLLVAPWPLFAFYVPGRLPSWSDAEVWLGFAILLAVTGGAALLLRRRHLLALAAVWWLASFLVVSQLVTPIGAYSEVRFAYPMLGALACGLGWLAERARVAPPALRRPALALGAAVAALAVVAVTIRNRDFRTFAALLEADARRQPNSPAALVRLASAYEDGRVAEAGALYARVTELAPDSAQAWYERGGYEDAQGHAAAARAMYERAVALYPRHHPALTALARLAIAAGELTEAEHLLAAAEKAAPDDPYVQLFWAVLEEQRGALAAARTRLDRLVARRPDFAPAVERLAALRQASPADARVRDPGPR